jgi:hypothetical protein
MRAPSLSSRESAGLANQCCDQEGIPSDSAFIEKALRRDFASSGALPVGPTGSDREIFPSRSPYRLFVPKPKAIVG